MSHAPYVTIAVPVYNGEAFIEEALRSIQQQTHRNIQVIISFDGPQSTSEQLCQRFLEDSRFRIVVQPERLGWVGHINWLMAQVDTPFWYLNAQDDLVDPRYVETLLAHAQNMPEAAVVYSDLVAFGLANETMTQSSVTGSAFARQLALLHEHHAAVAFRGLTRVEALHHAGPIRANEIESFSTDTTWMAAMARWGELQRVPTALYHKRYHSSNEHAKWLTWPAEKIAKAWMVHCVNMLEQAMLVEASIQERRLLWLACVGRLVSWRFDYVASANFSLTERASLLDSFLDYLPTVSYMDIPVWLEECWTHIRQWTRRFYLPVTKTGRAHNLASWLERRVLRAYQKLAR
jgi:glycosyltransferase involved in cell wall biosynthesis